MKENRHQKEIELVDKAYPYLMELADICLANMSGMTINVNGGHFEYISDRPEPNDVTTPSLNTFLEEKKKEFDKNFYHDTGDEYNDGCSCRFDDRKECDCQLKDIWSFISASISEAWELKVIPHRGE